LRFRVEPGEVAFTDRCLGAVRQDVRAEVGDFVVQTRDGVASYQLAVVVDDAASGITHVLRGEDLSHSTPRQLQLYRALGLPEPEYAHVPLVMGGAGERLAKRGGGFTVSEWRSAGVPAERVVGLLAHLSGLSALLPRRAAELVSDFSLDKVPKERARLDASSLARWLSP
jgi:glutamyl-tRNA synthetase